MDNKINIITGILLLTSWAIINAFVVNPIQRLAGNIMLFFGLYLLYKERVLEVAIYEKSRKEREIQKSIK